MLSFSASLSSNSNAFALFVSENYEYKDPRNILPKDIRRKIDLFLRLLKDKKQEGEISSLDISDKRKCFIIKVKKKI